MQHIGQTIKDAVVTIAPTRPRVAIFATCFNDTMFPKAPIATVKLLRRLGVDVEFPTEQTLSLIHI